MIARDHSARAARAVGDALPVVRAAASVRVLTVAEDKTDAIMQSGAALVDHLREHGVRQGVGKLREFPWYRCDRDGRLSSFAPE